MPLCTNQRQADKPGWPQGNLHLLHHLLCDEDLDQPRVATRGGGVQRRPQLVVLRVDAGAPVQQDLHHLFVVVDATLRWAERVSLEGHAQSVRGARGCCCRRPSETREERTMRSRAAAASLGSNIFIANDGQSSHRGLSASLAQHWIAPQISSTRGTRGAVQSCSSSFINDRYLVVIGWFKKQYKTTEFLIGQIKLHSILQELQGLSHGFDFFFLTTATDVMVLSCQLIARFDE